LYEEIETALLACDVGTEATQSLLGHLRERAGSARTAEELRSVLRKLLAELLAPLERPLELSAAKPCIIMLAGVNGAGKTTSAGKLARLFGTRAGPSCSLRATPFAPRRESSSQPGARGTRLRSSLSRVAIPGRSCSTLSPPHARAASTW